MKSGTIKNRVIWVVGAVVGLSICFLLCRYAFFWLHGMKQWPFALFVCGLITIIIGAIFGGRKIMICTVIAYIFGFMLGMLFNMDILDQGDGRLNNAWIIWTISFAIIIFIGVIWELVSRRMKKKKASEAQEKHYF